MTSLTRTAAPSTAMSPGPMRPPRRSSSTPSSCDCVVDSSISTPWPSCVTCSGRGGSDSTLTEEQYAAVGDRLLDRTARMPQCDGELRPLGHEDWEPLADLAVGN